MVGHGGSSAGSYLADPTSPIPSHCASIVATSTLEVKAHVHWIFYQVIAVAIGPSSLDSSDNQQCTRNSTNVTNRALSHSPDVTCT